MNTRVAELHNKFLTRYAVSVSLHKTNGDIAPLSLCSNENL